MKIRPIIKCHGGKFPICRHIIPLLPNHVVYTETFGGGGSVLLNKPKSYVEVFNDLDEDLMNLYHLIQTNPAGIFEKIGRFTYDLRTFQKCADYKSQPMDDMRAIAFLVRNRMSRGGMGKTFSKSNRLRGGIMGDANAWKTFVNDNLTQVVIRMANVRLFNRDALDIMKEFDAKDTTHYCDPPYVPETRTARKVYTHEMSVEDHARFLDCVDSLVGNVVISGYHHSLYDTRLRNWTLHEFNVANHSGQDKKKQRRIECLWIRRNDEGV